MRFSKLFFCFLSIAVSASSWAADALTFDCKRSEKGYTEEYEMRVIFSSAQQKGRVFLDDRDLDQSDEYGHQTVKSVTYVRPNILILIEASFDPENVMGIVYDAGTVSTQITLDTVTGKLKKIEKIQGGILGATIGNGTHVSEELCLPAKASQQGR